MFFKKRQFMAKQIEIQKITPFLWFNDNAEEAASFYTTVFNNSSVENITRYTGSGAKASGQPKGSVMTVAFLLEGLQFTAINGGPALQLTPAISLFVNCGTREEIDFIWEKLSKDGAVMMPLDKYPFSEKFGWVKDRFGVTWQLMLASGRQKIIPFLLFVGEQHGRAEEAMSFYMEIFKNSSPIHLDLFSPGEPGGTAGHVKNGSFFLENQEFMLMDGLGDHNFTFTPAFSFVVNCENQEEIDYYWQELSEGGDEAAQMCGWLQDKFGVSWQIIPRVWEEMFIKADDQKADKLMEAVLGMKKINLETMRRIDVES
jgi:predicted 3-demethylubiquinone-9 3-methyltransferase (glyoxalase superfamily)